MNRLLKQLQKLSNPTNIDSNYWIDATDALEFLAENIENDEIIIYANLNRVFIHAALVPKSVLFPLDISDLLGWNCSPSDTWSAVYSQLTASIKHPLAYAGSKILQKGEQLVFCRASDAALKYSTGIEILQKFTHVSGVYYLPEYNAWCRLDAHGEIERTIRIIEFPATNNAYAGIAVSFRKDLLLDYMALTETDLVRLFDFTRCHDLFLGWDNSEKEEVKNIRTDIFYRYRKNQDNCSYSRGFQILENKTSLETTAKNFWKKITQDDKNYASFIAYDRKTKQISEISCAPNSLASYFEISNLPFQITPAFFRPEVLLKYKSDKDKYRIQDRSISCRGTWHLETYDINEAGQVHTYLTYLNRLPYEEQLYWKSFNEPPKGSISKRALATDILGDYDESYNPLESLRKLLGELKCSWWILRSPGDLEWVNYPVTNSADEWKEELLNLDKLIIEGFDEKWLRRKAEELARSPSLKLRSLSLLSECLIGLGFEEERAKLIITPLVELHQLRTNVKAHTSHEKLKKLKFAAIKEHGSYRGHYEHLVKKCLDTLEILIKALS